MVKILGSFLFLDSYFSPGWYDLPIDKFVMFLH